MSKDHSKKTEKQDHTIVFKKSSKSLSSLVFELIKPYKKWLVVIFLAMLLETGMSLLGPWPLKIIIDNVVGHHALPGWLSWINDLTAGDSKMAIAGAAAIGLILIALIGGIAGYIDNYFTESVAQYVANDLRQKVYHHLQRLSLSYYDSHQIGNILSTITSDVSTIQSFASSALLSILIDALTILGMLGLMFYMNWDFALVAVAVTPLLLLFVARFKTAVKKATHAVRTQQSTMVSVLQQGLESVRAIKAFDRQDLEESHLQEVSMSTVNASLKARKVKSLLSPVVALIVSACTAFVLWRGAHLVLIQAMTLGGLTVFLSYLGKFFKPVQDLAKMTTSIAQASVALERIQAILDTDTVIPQKPNAKEPTNVKGHIDFEHVAFSYGPESPVLLDVNFSIKGGQRIGICGPTGGGKSTVVSLIPRFYDPTKGRVLIDGVDITDFQLHGDKGLR
ncbi:MAG TPA: ABC transporter ATP-binding protein, partial [Puia sp.]|nr:ABC transporter ATP-binding protein [Puia sp.]